MKKLFLLLTLASCDVREVKHKATVIDHSTSSSQTGNIYYHTILRLDNGDLWKEEGKEYYVLPLNHDTTITTLE